MKQRLPVIAMALAAVVVLAGCGAANQMGGGPMGGDHMGGGHMGGAPSSDDSTITDVPSGATRLEISTDEFAFKPNAVETPRGVTVIELKNVGRAEHDLSVDELGIHFHLNAGETGEHAYRFEPGSYEFYCSIPGHKQAGMVGRLVVT